MSNFCPVLSNPKVKNEFDDLCQMYGSVTAYTVWALNDGHHIKYNFDGTENVYYTNGEEKIKNAATEEEKQQLRKELYTTRMLQIKRGDDKLKTPKKFLNASFIDNYIIPALKLRGGDNVQFLSNKEMLQKVKETQSSGNAIYTFSPDRKKKKKIISVSHNGVIYINTSINTGRQKTYLYEYTHLWVQNLKSQPDSNERVGWKNISSSLKELVNNVLKKDSSKYTLEDKQIHDFFQTAISTFHYNPQNLTDQQWDTVLGEIIALYSTRENFDILLYAKRTIVSKMLTSLKNICTAFWEDVKTLFSKNEKEKPTNFKSLSNLILEDLTYDIATIREKRKQAQSLSEEEIERIEVETANNRNTILNRFRRKNSNSFQLGTLQTSNPALYNKLKLREEFDNNSTLSFSEKLSIIKIFEDTLFNFLYSIITDPESTFALYDDGTKPIVSDEIRQQIIKITKKNKFNPFVKIIKTIGTDNFQKLISDRVKQILHSLISDETRKLEVIGEIDKFTPIWFSKLNNFTRRTLDFKFKYDYQTTDDNDTTDLETTTEQENSELDPEDLENEVARDFLQISQTQVNLYKAVDKNVMFWLSGITSKNRDAFGRRVTFRAKDILDTLVMLFHDVDDWEELKDRLETSKLEFSNILLNRFKNNHQLRDKLVSSIQKAYNIYRQYSTTGESKVKDINKPEQTTRHAANTAFNGQISDTVQNDVNGTLFYVTEETGSQLFINETKLSQIKQHIKEAIDEFKNSLQHLPQSRSGIYANETAQIIDFDRAAAILASKLLDIFREMGFDDLSLSTIRNYLQGRYIQNKNTRDQKIYARHTHNLNQLSLTNLCDKLLAITNNSTSSIAEKTKDIRQLYIKAFSIIHKGEPKITKSSVRAGNKSYSTFSPLNFLQKFVNALKNPSGKAYAKLKEAFSKSIFHQRALQSGEGDSYTSWLDLIFNQNRDVTLTTTTTYDDIPYKEFNSLYYLLYSMVSFENGYYIAPTTSDKSTHGSIRVADPDQITGNTLPVDMQKRYETLFEQELDRMCHVYDMQQDGTKTTVKNMHTKTSSDVIPVGNGAFRFTFLPIFNDDLRLINDPKKRRHNIIAQGIYDIIKTGVLTNPEPFYKVVNKKINDYLLNEANKYRQQLLNTILFLEDCEVNDTKAIQQLTAYVNNKEFFNTWYANYHYANTQMQQMWTGDLIYYPSVTDTQKRNAEFVSPGTKQNAVSSSRYQSRKDRNISFVMFSDTKVDADNLQVKLDDGSKVTQTSLKSILERIYHNARLWRTSKITDKAKKKEVDEKLRAAYETKLSKYNGIDTTDGQGLISIDYVGRLLESLGRDTDFYSLYKQLVAIIDKYDPTKTGAEKEQQRKELLKEARKVLNNTDFVMETIKPFLYTLNLENEQDGMGELTPIQVKNAQFPGLDLVALLESKDDTMLQLVKWMRVNKIDAIYFASNVKVGAKGSIADKKISDYADSNELIADMDAHLAQPNGEAKYITSVDIGENKLQQETPSHYLDHNIRVGNQIIKLICNCLFDYENTVIPGTGMTGKQLRVKFFSLLGRKVQLEVNRTIKNHFGINGIKEFERIFKDIDNPDNIQYKEKLSNWLANQIRNDDDANLDLLNAVALNLNTGDFNLNLNNPVITGFVEKIITSVIKNTICELRMPGGQLVQVTDNIRTKKSIETDDSLKIVFNTDKFGNPKSIKYVECELPLFSKKLFGKYIIAEGEHAGEIDMKRIEKEDPKLLELVAYRIPTEGYCSMLPLKIVRFSSNITGGIIKLPSEAPALMGIDFDIDKLFTIFPELQQDGHTVEANEISLAGTNNSILQLMRTILTSEAALLHQMTPSGYVDITRWSEKMVVFDQEIRSQMAQIGPDETLDDMDVFTESAFTTVEQYSDDDLETKFKAVELDTDVNDVHTQATIHNRNFSGKKLLGIIAAILTQHSMNRLWNTRISGVKPFELNGVKIESEPILDKVYSSDDVTTVIDTLSEFLAAAPDTAKDPTFYNLNIGIGTIDMVITMLRLGFDLETVVLFLQQPIIKCMNTLDNYTENLTNQAIFKAMESFFSKIGVELTDYEGDNISRDDLITNMALHSFTKEDADFVNQQYHIFLIAKQLLSISSKSFDISKIVNLNNASSLQLNGDLFRMVLSQKQITDLLDKLENPEADNLDFSRNLATVLRKPTENLDSSNYNAFLASVFNNRQLLLDALTSALAPVMHYFSQLPQNDTLRSANSLRLVYNDWLTYVLFNLPTEDGDVLLSHDENIREYYKNIFPLQIARIRTELLQQPEYRNNSFLQRLNCGNEYESSVSIASYGLNATDVLYLTEGWEQLLTDKDQKIRDLFTELFIYELYHSGLSFNSSTLTRLAPVRLIQQIPAYNQFFTQLANMAKSENPELLRVSNEFFALKEQYDNTAYSETTNSDRYHNWYSENLQVAVEDEPLELSEDLDSETVVFDPTQFFISGLNFSNAEREKLINESKKKSIKIC